MRRSKTFPNSFVSLSLSLCSFILNSFYFEFIYPLCYPPTFCLSRSHPKPPISFILDPTESRVRLINAHNPETLFFLRSHPEASGRSGHSLSRHRSQCAYVQISAPMFVHVDLRACVEKKNLFYTCLLSNAGERNVPPPDNCRIYTQGFTLKYLQFFNA